MAWSQSPLLGNNLSSTSVVPKSWRSLDVLLVFGPCWNQKMLESDITKGCEQQLQ